MTERKRKEEDDNDDDNDKFASTNLTMIIADNKISLITELKDDRRESFLQAACLSLLSTSGPIVSSYARIFASLWVEAETIDKLEDLNRMQREFIHIAAHELRTPIQPIMGMIDILKLRLGGADNNSGSSSGSGESRKVAQITDRQLAIMERNAKRLQKLSSEILDATRIEAGTLKLNTETLDINEEVRNVIADAQSMIPDSKNIEIEFAPYKTATADHGESADDIPPLLVNADRLRIFEVLSNLIKNAVKFSTRDDDYDTGSLGDSIVIPITISTAKRDDGQVLVSIRDCGAGISSNMLPRLFSKFAVDKERGGTGLGLFIAKSIVEAHGGRIRAENNQDGKGGATFAFTLPLVEAKS